MNIILFGPQGSGKGTQAESLAKDFGLYHMSTGDELRKQIKEKTEIGKKAEAIIARGELVPTEMINQIVLNISKSKEAKNGMLFDGYPRTLDQWEFMSKKFKIDAAIELDLPDKESINRIASRRLCPKCGKNYNTIYLKPKVDGKCDVDKETLIQRPDDKPAEIKKRLDIYHSQTEPLKKEYKKIGILQMIDGNQPIEKVHKDILAVLKKN